VELAVATVEVGVGEEAAPGPGKEGEANEARGLVRRETEEDLVDELVRQVRRQRRRVVRHARRQRRHGLRDSAWGSLGRRRDELGGLADDRGIGGGMASGGEAAAAAADLNGEGHE
jgi:hypothetical protein